jgi:hypothetical protein
MTDRGSLRAKSALQKGATLTDKLKLAGQVMPYVGLVCNLIVVLRAVTGAEYRSYSVLGVRIAVIAHLNRIVLRVVKRRTGSRLWSTLWLDKNFHSLLMLLSLVAAETYPIALSLSYLVHYLIRSAKLVLYKIAPRLGDSAIEVSKACQKIVQSEDLVIIHALFELAICPWLIFTSFDEQNVPLFMAGCATGIVYLPFASIVSTGHRLLWKEINLIYTEIVFGSEATDFQPILIWILNVFREITDLLYGLYPLSFVEKWRSD